MLQIGIPVIDEHMVAIVGVDRWVVARSDDMCRCHAEVPVFVEPRGMFNASRLYNVVWKPLAFFTRKTFLVFLDACFT